MSLNNILFSVFVLTSMKVVTHKCGYDKIIGSKKLPTSPGTPSISKHLAHYLTPHNLTLNMKFHIDVPLYMFSEDKMAKNVYFRRWKIRTKRLVKKTEKFFLRSHMYLPLKINILAIKFVLSTISFVFKPKRTQQQLTDYAAWQKNKKQMDRNGKENVWYYSVLLTDMSMPSYKKSGERIISRGTAYRNGFCNVGTSCALLHYRPNIDEMVTTFAHELAHSFNVTHDEVTTCDEFGVMTAGFRSDMIPTVWTNCSRRQIEEFLYQNASWCLNDLHNNNLRNISSAQPDSEPLHTQIIE